MGLGEGGRCLVPLPRGLEVGKAVLGPSEARRRDELRLAQAKLGLLVSELAQAEQAATRAQVRAWDREHDVADREAAAQKRRDAGMSDGEERALVESVLGGGMLVEEKEAPDPELERLKTEAHALRVAASKLKARLPERREQIPFAENAVRAAVRAAVASSGAVEALLVRAAELQAKLIGSMAACAATSLPSDRLSTIAVKAARHEPLDRACALVRRAASRNPARHLRTRIFSRRSPASSRTTVPFAAAIPP